MSSESPTPKPGPLQGSQLVSSHRQGKHCHLPRVLEGWGMGHF